MSGAATMRPAAGAPAASAGAGADQGGPGRHPHRAGAAAGGDRAMALLPFGGGAFVFEGRLKKAAYAHGLEGEPLVPVQAVTAVLSSLAGLAGVALFLAGPDLPHQPDRRRRGVLRYRRRACFHAVLMPRPCRAAA